MRSRSVTGVAQLPAPVLVLTKSDLSFVDNDGSVYGVYPGQFSRIIETPGQHSWIDIDASQNYWDGLSESDVKELVYDKTVTIEKKGTVIILLLLTEPHTDTPDCYQG